MPLNQSSLYKNPLLLTNYFPYFNSLNSYYKIRLSNLLEWHNYLSHNTTSNNIIDSIYYF